jgi:diadenosine tetraphosphate (Ap4A) HIT family hydrolase
VSDTPKLVIPGIEYPDDLARIARARTYKYYCQLVEQTKAGVCTFCVVDRDYNKVVIETNLWLVWHCKPPEKNTHEHLLFVPKRHVTRRRELSTNELMEFFSRSGVLGQAEQMFGEIYGGLFRNDAPKLAGTQAHWHFHMMFPDPEKGRVESPIAKSAVEELNDIRKAIVFEKIRQANGEIIFLDSDEYAFVKDREVPETVKLKPIYKPDISTLGP